MRQSWNLVWSRVYRVRAKEEYGHTPSADIRAIHDTAYNVLVLALLVRRGGDGAFEQFFRAFDLC